MSTASQPLPPPQVSGVPEYGQGPPQDDKQQQQARQLGLHRGEELQQQHALHAPADNSGARLELRHRSRPPEKALITAALAAANDAVAFDAQNNVEAALRSYTTAIELLDQASAGRSPSDCAKLLNIRDIYAERTRLLQALTPVSQSAEPTNDVSVVSGPTDEDSIFGTASGDEDWGGERLDIESKLSVSGSTIDRSADAGSSTLEPPGSSVRIAVSPTATSPRLGPSRTSSLPFGTLARSKATGEKRDRWTLEDVLQEDPSRALQPLPEGATPTGYHRHFWLARTLAGSITNGAFLSRRLYVPRLVWIQPGPCRLPSLAAKIAACEVVSAACDAMRAGCGISGVDASVPPSASSVSPPVFAPPRDLAAAAWELDQLAEAMDTAHAMLARKLAFLPADLGLVFTSGRSDRPPSTGAPPPVPAPKGEDERGDGSGKDVAFQGTERDGKERDRSSVKVARLRSIRDKISKSVDKVMGDYIDRMKGGGGKDKMDESSAYTNALFRLFTSTQFLDDWLYHAEQLEAAARSPDHQQQQDSAPSPPSDTALWARILARLRHASDFVGVVTAFALRDLGVLMAKHVKQGRNWIVE